MGKKEKKGTEGKRTVKRKFDMKKEKRISKKKTVVVILLAVLLLPAVAGIWYILALHSTHELLPGKKYCRGRALQFESGRGYSGDDYWV